MIINVLYLKRWIFIFVSICKKIQMGSPNHANVVVCSHINPKIVERIWIPSRMQVPVTIAVTRATFWEHPLSPIPGALGEEF